MANVKITALEHISSIQLAPEDVFVIDDVSSLITRKVTLSNVTRYISTSVGVDDVQSNLDSYAAYANANAVALSNAISSLSVDLGLSGNTGSDILTVGTDTLSVYGTNGLTSTITDNSITISMVDSGVTSGRYGGVTGTSSQIPTFTVDSTGRITSASNVSLQVDFASVYSNINLVSSNVSSVVTSIGNLNNLITSEKSNLVAAINEAASNTVTSIITVDAFKMDTIVASNVSSVGTSIPIMTKANKFAKLIVHVEDLTYGQQQSSEILLVQDTIEVKTTEYAIVFTSTNPIATFDAAFAGEDVILNAYPSSSDNIIRIFKILT